MMTLRRSFVFALCAFSSLALAGGQSGQLGKTIEVKPLRSHGQPSRAAVFNTRSLFPQIMRPLQQPFIRPENPTRGLSIRESGPAYVGPSGMTDMTGPTPGAYFPGITMTGWIPADPDMAVGPNNIVEVVNTQIGFFTKGGTLQLQTAATSFFASVKEGGGDDLFDPKVMYDRIANRWVIVFLEQNNGISNALFAISDDSDPNGSWFLYRFDAKQTVGSLAWLDYPGFGYNKDGYVINGNLFRFAGGSFGGVEFIVLNKTPLLTGAATTPTYFLDTSGFGSAQMAETVDPVKDTVFGALRSFTNQDRFYAFRNLNGAPTMSLLDLVVGNASSPPGSVQSTNGGVFDTVGARIFTAIWRGGRLYLSYNVTAGGAFAGSHWTELNTGTWPVSGSITELQAGDYTNASVNQFMPAVNVNKNGDVSILFTRCNTALTGDVASAGRISIDTLNTMSAPVTLANSAGNAYGQFRWGDYFGCDVDPTDDETFWGSAMTVRSDNLWTTFIVSWVISKHYPVSPTAFSLFRGLLAGGNLASLQNVDGNYLVVQKGLVLNASEPPIQLDVDGTAPVGQVLSIDFSATAKVSTPGLSQRVQLMNWSTGLFDTVGTQVATTTDSVQNVSASGTLANYVQVGTRLVRTRIQWFQTGIVVSNSWTSSTDQAKWSIRAR